MVTYSGGMYPNVPTRRVCNEALPYSDSFDSPKSATCTRGLVSCICIKAFFETDNKYQGIFALPLRGSFCLLRCLPTWCHDECRQEQCVRGCIQVPLLNPRLFASWLATATDLGQKSHANVDSNYHFQCTHIPEIRSPQHNIRSSVPAKNEMLVHTIRYWNNLVQINTELNRMLAQNKFLNVSSVFSLGYILRWIKCH